MSIVIQYNPNLRNNAKALRKAGILSEILLWDQIKRGQINGLDFDRQRIMGNYIVDFCCPDTGVVIEIDGHSHDFKELHDTKREEYLKSLGLETIHIADIDVKQSLDGVVGMLKAHPFLQNPIKDRKCVFIHNSPLVN
ncbi:MAG: DUF559 domain-containing protein [Rickettsiales bacterium]|nr:DUF559 domain-containing protein [Rickettsiales bacterium]